MDWFQKLERKYSKYAIQNLMMYIIVLYAVGFVFEVFAPGVYSTYLSLDFAYIFKGQIWRLVTFIIQPPSTSIIFVFFSLYFYYLIGTVLENIWIQNLMVIKIFYFLDLFFVALGRRCNAPEIS